MPTTISTDRDNRRFLLTNDFFSYGIEISGEGLPINLHWGAPLHEIGDLPSITERRGRRFEPAMTPNLRQEYPAFHGEFFDECALKATHPGGNRGTRLAFSGAEVAGDSLAIALDGGDVMVKLHYRLTGSLLFRHAEIHNAGTAPATLENYASAAWQMPDTATDWRLTRLWGHANMEHMIQRDFPGKGRHVLQNRTGLSGPFHEPFFALDDGTATEFSGEVFFGALFWNGNWRITVDSNPYDMTCVLGGIDEYDNALTLQPGETFTTPQFCAGRVDGGFSEMTRVIHHLIRDELSPRGVAVRPMPVVTNTWCSLGLKVDEASVIGNLSLASQAGAELFVIDDGWQTHIGDWQPDPVKFPRGLSPVIAQARKLGMKLGLWVEIESCELCSRFYREHPDWAMHYPGIAPSCRERPDIGRRTVMVNLANREAADNLYGQLRELLLTTGIDYLKLDMNCYFSSPGGDRVWIDYVLNFNGIWRRLVDEFPEVIFENCASGAGRISLDMARYFSRCNRSDDQDALDALYLHAGFTYLNLPRCAGGGAHISDSTRDFNLRRIPRKFQAYAGMLGDLSFSLDLRKCTAAEIEELHGYIQLFKKLRRVTHFADFLRIETAEKYPRFVYEYVSPDRNEAVVFVFGTQQRLSRRLPAVRLRWLNPGLKYHIEVHGRNAMAIPQIREEITGAGAMTIGLQLEVTGDYDCYILHLTEA